MKLIGAEKDLTYLGPGNVGKDRTKVKYELGMMRVVSKITILKMFWYYLLEEDNINQSINRR
jgi:hypothetical protein